MTIVRFTVLDRSEHLDSNSEHSGEDSEHLDLNSEH
jgi:hypothetical protein